jgi:DNA-binding NarL/FixJ family response regulator
MIDDIDKEILKHLFEGKTSKEIAPLVFRSKDNVDYRLHQMKRKFECRNNVQLAVKLLSEKIETSKD